MPKIVQQNGRLVGLSHVVVVGHAANVLDLDHIARVQQVAAQSKQPFSSMRGGNSPRLNTREDEVKLAGKATHRSPSMVTTPRSPVLLFLSHENAHKHEVSA